MKRIWYYCMAVILVVSISCSEQEDIKKPVSPILEQRVLQEKSFSFYIRADETITEGTVYAAIQKEGEVALTIDEVKKHHSGFQKTLSGDVPGIGSFSSLTPQTSYIIYAFLEVEGVASDMATMKITTP